MPSAMPHFCCLFQSTWEFNRGPPLRSMSGPPPPAVLSASAPLSFTLGGRRSFPPSGTPPGPWALQRGVLWWHRTPSSSQGPSLSDQGVPVPNFLLVGVWPLSLVFPLPCPGGGTVWRFPAAPVPPCWRHIRCGGWPAADDDKFINY